MHAQRWRAHRTHCASHCAASCAPLAHAASSVARLRYAFSPLGFFAHTRSSRAFAHVNAARLTLPTRACLPLTSALYACTLHIARICGLRTSRSAFISALANIMLLRCTHTHTFSRTAAHPLSCAAVLRTVRIGIQDCSLTHAHLASCAFCLAYRTATHRLRTRTHTAPLHTHAESTYICAHHHLCCTPLGFTAPARLFSHPAHSLPLRSCRTSFRIINLISDHSSEGFGCRAHLPAYMPTAPPHHHLHAPSHTHHTSIQMNRDTPHLLRAASLPAPLLRARHGPGSFAYLRYATQHTRTLRRCRLVNVRLRTARRRTTLRIFAHGTYCHLPSPHLPHAALFCLHACATDRFTAVSSPRRTPPVHCALRTHWIGLCTALRFYGTVTPAARAHHCARMACALGIPSCYALLPRACTHYTHFAAAASLGCS